jgi:hypothetical protein
MKKVTKFPSNLFRIDGSCIRVYRNRGVATAAGVEALPNPQERDNYRLECYFQKIL